MSEKKKIVINSLLFSIAPFIPKIVSVALLPIMTKYLTDVDFGIAGTISAYSQSIGVFATLGLSVVVMNSFFKDSENYKQIWRNIYGFLNCWMFFYALFQAIILYFCIPIEAEKNKWWIILFSNFSNVLFGPTAIIGNAYYVYNKKSIPVVWRNIMAAIITLFVNFFLIVYLKMGYMGWYIGSFVGTFFINASYWYVVNIKLQLKPSLHFSWKEIGRYLSVSLPTMPHYYTMYLLEGSGRAILDHNGISQTQIGKVSISQQVGDIFQMGMNGMNNALSPYFMQSIKQGDFIKYRLLSLGFISIVFIFAFLGAIWSKEIFSILLSNESLASSYPYFILYIMALCYRPLYIIASNYFFYYEKTKQLLMITFTSGCIAMALYMLFVPKYGVWAFLIGHYIACLYYGYSGFFFNCYKENAKENVPFVLLFIIQLILTISAYLIVDMLFFKLLLSLVVILVLFFFVVRKMFYRNN